MARAFEVIRVVKVGLVIGVVEDEGMVKFVEVVRVHGEVRVVEAI